MSSPPLPASLKIIEQSDYAWIVEHRYRNNGGAVTMLLLFTLGWGFFSYMATVKIWESFPRHDQSGIVVLVPALLLVPVLYGLTLISLYFLFWALGGRTRFRKEYDSLRITYLHPWFSTTLTIPKSNVNRLVQRAYHQSHLSRIHQRDL